MRLERCPSSCGKSFLLAKNYEAADPWNMDRNSQRRHLAKKRYTHFKNCYMERSGHDSHDSWNINWSSKAKNGITVLSEIKKERHCTKVLYKDRYCKNIIFIGLFLTSVKIILSFFQDRRSFNKRINKLISEHSTFAPNNICFLTFSSY